MNDTSDQNSPENPFVYLKISILIQICCCLARTPKDAIVYLLMETKTTHATTPITKTLAAPAPMLPHKTACEEPQNNTKQIANRLLILAVFERKDCTAYCEYSLWMWHWCLCQMSWSLFLEGLKMLQWTWSLFLEELKMLEWTTSRSLLCWNFNWWTLFCCQVFVLQLFSVAHGSGWQPQLLYSCQQDQIVFMGCSAIPELCTCLCMVVLLSTDHCCDMWLFLLSHHDTNMWPGILGCRGHCTWFCWKMECLQALGRHLKLCMMIVVWIRLFNPFAPESHNVSTVKEQLENNA